MKRPSSASPHNRTQSQSLTEYPADASESGGDKSSTVTGGRSSSVAVRSRVGGGGGSRFSAIGSNIGRNTASSLGYNGSSVLGMNSSSGKPRTPQHQHIRHTNPQLFEPGGAGAARRALLYDMERHKLESLPLTRLFRFLADSPHWFTDASSGYASTDGGKSSGSNNNNNNGKGGSSTTNKNNTSSSSPSHPHAMIKSLVVASPEGGRHVSKRQRDIDRARLASVLADRQDDLIIPDTIVWEASIPRGWFYTSFDGSDGRATVQRRSVEIGTIEKQWTEGLPPHAVAAAYYTIAERDPAASLADRDTPLLQFQFLRACELSKFLHVQATQTSGSDCAAILQQFTYPLHAHNVVIQAAWSPRVLNITIRQNVNALHDDRLDANSRACTFEGSPHLSLELRPTTRLYGQVEATVNSLTKHFAAVDLKNRIVRLVAYFKVDKESRLNLLYVPSIRVMRTALIERPIGMRSSPFFSSFRVALDFAVEYETLTTDTRAWAVTSSSNNNNNNNKNSSSDGQQSSAEHHSPGSTLLGGGGSRIRKSASNNKKNGASEAAKRRAETDGGSRLLSDALDKAFAELNISRQSQAEAMSRSHRQSTNNNNNKSGLFGNDNTDGNTDTSRNIFTIEEEDSIQYQLSHSPVIGQQRAELVEVVMEIVRASRTGKQASAAVTRAYRHAATPAARDALKWAAVEAGMICKDDDGFSHPFFEVSPSLLELMKLICEDYRPDLEEKEKKNEKENNNSKNNNISTSNTPRNYAEQQGSPAYSGRELSTGSGGTTTTNNNNNEFHSFDHLRSNELGVSMRSDRSSNQNYNHQQHQNLLFSPGNPHLISSPLSENQQQHQLLFSPALTASSAAGSPFPNSSLNLQQQQHQLMSGTLPPQLGNSMMLLSPTSGSVNGNTVRATWMTFSQPLKSGVFDFLYELVDSAVIAPENFASSTTAQNFNSVPQDYFAKLGSVSREAAQVCDIVLETCRSAAVVAFENDQSNPTIHRSLPLAVGHLWRDVAVRDAVAVLISAVFGLMYIPTTTTKKSSSSSAGERRSSVTSLLNKKQNNIKEGDFYSQLLAKERMEKEQEREKRRQRFLKEQQEQQQNNNNDDLPSSPSLVKSPTTSTSSTQNVVSNSAAANFDKQEDVSIYYEGLSTHANASSTLPKIAEVVLKSEEGGSESNNHVLEVSVKNYASMNLECQVRKTLGDVFAALARSPIDLLLPEMIEERKKALLNQGGNKSPVTNVKRRRSSNSVIMDSPMMNDIIDNHNASSRNARNRSQTMKVTSTNHSSTRSSPSPSKQLSSPQQKQMTMSGGSSTSPLIPISLRAKGETTAAVGVGAGVTLNQSQSVRSSLNTNHNNSQSFNENSKSRNSRNSNNSRNNEGEIGTTKPKKGFMDLSSSSDDFEESD